MANWLDDMIDEYRKGIADMESGRLHIYKGPSMNAASDVTQQTLEQYWKVLEMLEQLAAQGSDPVPMKDPLGRD